MTKSIFITGIAGSGKSSVSEELRSRGYQAYDIEEIEGLFKSIDKNTGMTFVNHDNDDLESVKRHDWVCDKEKLQNLIEKETSPLAFYCGTASNADELLPLFDRAIVLNATPETIRKRLGSRASKVFGRSPEVLDWVLSWKDWWEDHMQEQGAITVDANRNLAEVISEIIEISKN